MSRRTGHPNDVSTPESAYSGHHRRRHRWVAIDVFQDNALEDTRPATGMADDFEPVSLTIEQTLLTELDEVLEEWDYASRSEAVRDALRDFLTEYRWRTNLSGHHRGSVAVVHDHHVEGVTDAMLDIQHEHLELITAVQHVHLSHNLCLETLIVDGPGQEITQVVNRLQALRGVRQVELALVGE